MKQINLKIAVILLLVLSSAKLSAMPADSLKNIVYRTGKTWKNTDQNLTMDIYFPEREGDKKYPLVLLMHGGGFSSGSKEAMKSHCKLLADSGFIAVTINYRKGWNRGENALGCNGNVTQLQEAVYRAIQDGHAALRYLVGKQKDYAIDTAWIFVAGSSAGGVMALNLAYLNTEKIKQIFPAGVNQLGDLYLSSNTIKQSYQIKGICNMWGALPDSTMVTPKNAVPTIFFHGSNDMIVPFDVGRFGSFCNNYPMMFGSACIYRQTKAAGKATILNVAKGANHGPKEFYSKITMSNTACFFHSIMASTASGAQIYDKAKIGCR